MKNSPAVSLVALAISLSFVHGASAAAQDVTAPEATAQAVTAQDAPPATNEPDEAIDPTEGESIVVIADRLIGQLQVPQPPVLELDAEDIAAYGAGSIADLISELGAQTSSGSGRGGGFPAILVNGVRVSSFRELRSYPPEAIEKVEVFPEDVAQRYGFSPNQRVVNIVLKRNFASREVEVEYGQPWDGGYSTKEAEATYLQLIGGSRVNVNLGWDDSSLLTEAERGVVQADGGVPTLATDPDQALYRSLVADSAGLEATGNFTTSLDDSGTSLSVNATFERDDSLRYQGLDSVVLTAPDGVTSVLRTLGEDDPLTVDSRTTTYAFGTTLNAGLGDWQITGTADANRVKSRSLIDRRADTSALAAAAAAGTLALDADLGELPDAGFDESRSTTDTVSGLVTAIGHPVLLPAGELSLTFDTGYDFTRIESEDTRNPGVTTALKRGDLSAGVNVGVPIASVRDDHWAAIGDLTLNATAGINELSDFGTLTDWSLGMNWAPLERLNLSVNYTARDAAPSLGQLGNPEIRTVNVPVFDLTTGETVLATIVTGGNPALPAQSQRDWRVGLNWELPELSFIERGRISLEYFKNHSEDVATGFPVLTPTIEAAFPGRVTRDPVTGSVTEIDQRPVTFAQQDSQRIRIGLNLNGPFGKARPQAQQGGGNPLGAVFGAIRGPQGQGAQGQGGQPGAGGPGFNPEQFAAVRQRLCAPPAEGADPQAIPDLTGLPEPLLARLRGEDGEIDPARFAEFRTRMCSQDGPPQGGFRPGQGQAGPGAGGPPGGPGAGRGGFRGPGGPGGGDGRGRWFVNFDYSYELENEVLVAPGGPLLDLLDGDALSGGGQPRHSASARVGLFYAGFGLNMSGRYNGSSRIDGTGLPGSTDLFFDDYVTFDIRMFADLNQRTKLIEQVPLLKNTRISFDVDNVFDARQRVTDSAGLVPLRYQPYLIDPIGRTFEIELRKLF